MASAFQCDRCKSLQAGTALGKLTFQIVGKPSSDEVYCDSCLALLTDFRISGAPPQNEDSA